MSARSGSGIRSGISGARGLLYRLQERQFRRVVADGFGGGKVTRVQRLLTLQNLVRLAGADEISGELETPIIIPGKLLFSIPHRSPLQLSATFGADSLNGGLAEAVAPIAGKTFSYESSLQQDVKSKYFSKHSTSAISLSCTVENVLDASKLNPKMKGSYLPVTCQRTINKEISVDRLAYLIESGIYVVLGSTLPGGKQEVRTIIDVEYAEQNASVQK